MSNRDSATASTMAKLKGQKWKLFAELANKWTGLDSDDEDIPISELTGEHRKSSKSHGSHHKSKSSSSSSSSSATANSQNAARSSSNASANRPKGSVMRLDRADMGLYGLCPETDPFYAVICDICGSVVKPQGLQKHMSNRHHSYYSHAAKNVSTSSYSSRDHHSSSSSEVSSRSAAASSSESSASRSEKLHQSSSSSSSHSSKQQHEDLDNTPLKIRSSSSSKVKGKNGKSTSSSSSHSSSHHNGKSSSSGSSSSSSKSSTHNDVNPPTEAHSSSSAKHESSGSATAAAPVAASNSSSSATLLDKKGFLLSADRKGDRSREYDPDKHCGVQSADGKRNCTRPLSCKSHSLSSRRAVTGRSKAFDKLLSDHKAGAAGAATSKEENYIEVESSSNSSSGFDAADRGRNAAAATAGEHPGLPEGTTHLSFTPEKSSPRAESAPSTPGSLKAAASSSGSIVSSSPKSETKTDRSSKHKQSRGTSSQPKYQEPPALVPPISPAAFAGQQPRSAAKRDQQQVTMPAAAAEILAQHFVEENPNTVLSDATIVVDPTTNELKLSVSGTLHPTSENETAEESIQQFANSLQEQQLTVTVPLSVISSMNISGTNLVSVNAGTDDAALAGSTATTVTMHAGEILTTADVTSGEAEQQQFIPAELIGQLPLVQATNGAELHDPNQYITTTTGQELSEHALISNYNDQINYTLQTLAQNLQNAEQLSGQTLQTDLSESIDDIVPTINLLPSTANPLVLPQLQADLADSIILTPNQLSTISQSLVEQHYIENVALKPELEILTVNTPVDISKLNLLRTVDAEFLKERHAQQQQQQQANTMYHAQIDDFRGVKMWYSNLPKPLHVNNFQLRKLGGGYVMNRKLLNIRKNLVSESNNLAKSLNSQLSPIGGPRSALNFNTSGARSGDLLSPIAGMGKSKDTNGGLGLSSSPTANRLGQVNRGQRRLILPQAAIKKPTEKTSCLLSNAYFKNLISSMQQQQQQTVSHQTPTTNTNHSLKRPSSSSLTSLSNKRLKIINNLQNSTAPPQMLLQQGSSSGKVKPKVL
ncbi:hypothetical protein pipiens_017994 [Culex pipiens pipiens]|uniref:SCA7 domain-containing protein n=1 Tax=Culex pipiens pipiens TaxID=38569 RepID=A0ABD1CEK6_CULPP